MEGIEYSNSSLCIFYDRICIFVYVLESGNALYEGQSEHFGLKQQNEIKFLCRKGSWNWIWQLWGSAQNEERLFHETWKKFKLVEWKFNWCLNRTSEEPRRTFTLRSYQFGHCCVVAVLTNMTQQFHFETLLKETLTKLQNSKSAENQDLYTFNSETRQYPTCSVPEQLLYCSLRFECEHDHSV